MIPVPVIAIFDIGRTNKKFFLIDEQYIIVLERSVQFAEILDEDGFACEDVQQLSHWVQETLSETMLFSSFNIKAINFSAYGASFVHIDEKGKPVAPLYNYLKPYPPALQEKFYSVYGSAEKISLETASPELGSLNSGMQLYRLKQERDLLFQRIKYSLHLPQYLSYLVTGKAYTDITSIGCHTQLWDFSKSNYHHWVYAEKIDNILPPLFPSDKSITITIQDKEIEAGIGLHDSSAALIPYLASFSAPFILLSTGTWCISLHPFSNELLTAQELEQDCLCYLEYYGHPVKASRLFAGNEHELQVKILADHFNVASDYYRQVVFIPSLWKKMNTAIEVDPVKTGLHVSPFADRNLGIFISFEEAYHQLIYDIIRQQQLSTSLVLGATKVSRIFVDGGFARNAVYMHMLAAAFPVMQVFSASVSQATAIGAALAIHDSWNSKPVPADIIDLKLFPSNF